MDTPDTKPEGEGAAFNAAVAALMRLNKILLDIESLVLNRQIAFAEKQHIKIRLTRAFYTQSIALLKDEDDKEKIKIEVSKLKPALKKKEGHSCSTLIFSWELEEQIDNVLILIQEALQKEGYLMPSKQDTGLR